MAGLPQTIGRFEILRELGRGMTGVVFEARDPALSRTVALKMIDPANAVPAGEREAFTQRFESEARIAGRLSHPNIVVVHDVGQDPETEILYIALERLPGETLGALVQKGIHLPWRQALDIGAQLADALEHAHEHGIVHRDIKPANVMLLPNGQVKLMDFGIAKLEASQLTAAGQFFGTPLYMAPEQAGNGTVDGRSDLFALGSVLYTLLTGRHAFAGDNVLQILRRVVEDDPPPPGGVVPEIPPAVDGIIARCLAKAPNDRYPSARHLREDILEVLGGRAPRHSASPKPGLAAGASGASADEDGPAAATLTVDVNPLEKLLDAPGASRAAAPAAPRRRKAMLLGLGAIGALALALGVPRLLPPDTPAPEASPEANGAGSVAAGAGKVPAPPPEPTPAPTPPPARIVVDFRHPLRSGTLRILMDGEPVVGRSVAGGVARDLLVAKLHGGVFTDLVEVEPGRHEFEVEVTWDDNTRLEHIRGVFDRDETYRLEIRLGRLRRNLSLKWTR
ncbi:MAG: serine/threonine protein kinase [Acidobacteria bacterium]|jgi:serine/threonine-protein kinase|nr:serine/threonine protein kinase [Acidobacteriota bacterium]